MTIQIFSNNAKSTLASGINSSVTTITVAVGTGAEFPNPSAGQQFKVTLNSVSLTTVYEICNCTSRSGDVLTVIRGQEGTTATAFNTGDFVGHFNTAGVATDWTQSEQLQNGKYTVAVAGGTANALTATIASNLTALPNGYSIVILAASANSGASTLNLTLGSTVTGVLPIVTGNNTAVVSGTIPSAGYPLGLIYSSTYNAWVLSNGYVNLAVYAPINSPTFTGTPEAPTYTPPAPTAPIPTTQLATLGYVYNSLQNYATINSPTFTGTPSAPTASSGTNSTQIATTAFVQTAISAIYPVGSIYTSTVATNPNTLFGFGTWVAFGAGQVMIGVGGGFVAGATGGSADATLPVHSHNYSGTTTNQNQDHNHGVNAYVGTSQGGLNAGLSVADTTSYETPTGRANTSNNSVGHDHAFSGATDSQGGSPTNANLPPYIVVYMWNRTA